MQSCMPVGVLLAEGVYGLTASRRVSRAKEDVSVFMLFKNCRGGGETDTFVCAGYEYAFDVCPLIGLDPLMVLLQSRA